MKPVPELSQASRSGFPVWPCPEGCGQVNDMLRGTCRGCGAHRPCEYFDGDQRCGEVPTHMYISGARCDPHAPGALKRTSRMTSPTRQKEAA